jgi:hypothetical protein
MKDRTLDGPHPTDCFSLCAHTRALFRRSVTKAKSDAPYQGFWCTYQERYTIPPCLARQSFHTVPRCNVPGATFSRRLPASPYSLDPDSRAAQLPARLAAQPATTNARCLWRSCGTGRYASCSLQSQFKSWIKQHKCFAGIFCRGHVSR